MSENDAADERMERAERIRKLREQGGSNGTGEATESAPSGDDSESEPDETEAAASAGEAAGTTTEADSTTTAANGPGGATGIELPDQDQIDAAIEAGGGQAAQAQPAEDTGLGATARGQAATTVEADARVLEFSLGDELYCIDIAGVEEIVKRETVTRVPNTPEYVEGVVDLRGQITTILDAKRMLDIEESGRESLVVVFAPDAFEDQGAVGWVVDEVRQVRPVHEDQVRDPPSDEGYVEGIVDREEADELLVWVEPDAAMTSAIGEDEAE